MKRNTVALVVVITLFVWALVGQYRTTARVHRAIERSDVFLDSLIEYREYNRTVLMEGDSLTLVDSTLYIGDGYVNKVVFLLPDNQHITIYREDLLKYLDWGMRWRVK